MALVYIYIYTSEIIPKEKLYWVSVPWMFSILLILIRHSVVMPRTGLIICLSIHLPFYSWKYHSEQTITNSIVVQICFFLVEYLAKIWCCYATDLALRWIWGPPRAKRSAIFLPKSQHEGPWTHCGKKHGRIYGYRNNRAASEVRMQISAPWHRQICFFS